MQIINLRLSYNGKYKNTTDNVFFSPYSISSALEMAYEGARSNTASEMRSVFHFPTNADVRIPSFAKQYNQINPPNAPYQLSTANALWAEISYSINISYLEIVEANYGGKATNLDFVNDTEGSRQTINSWISSKTNNKIPELLVKGTISPLTRLILTNAIYFKGNWSRPFRKSLTQEKNFTTSTETKIKCSMMNNLGLIGYNETNDYPAIKLSYENDDLSMIIILPKNGKIAAVEKTIDINEFKNITDSLNLEHVDIYLPKFKFDKEYTMNDELSTMGMPTAFSPDNADFTGLYDKVKADNKNLYIDRIIHKAYVDVDEEGTEAAASTGMSMIGASTAMEKRQPKIFNADHPFIFFIVHENTGTILFIGKINDPGDISKEEYA